MRFKALGKDRPPIEISTLADIMSDEVMSNKKTLVFRLGVGFIKSLSPDAEEILKELEKEGKETQQKKK